MTKWRIVVGLACSTSLMRCAGGEEAVYNSTPGEAATRFFGAHAYWPTNTQELVDSATKAGWGRFRPEDYAAMHSESLENGKLQIELTWRSGTHTTNICDRPQTTAAAIIKKEGYLIVLDGSSFYYLDADGTFCSGAVGGMGFGGRVITNGKYSVIGGANFTATGDMHYLNSPNVPARYEMNFMINSVEAEAQPFDRSDFIAVLDHKKWPAHPVCHKAYFAFSSLCMKYFY